MVSASRPSAPSSSSPFTIRARPSRSPSRAAPASNTSSTSTMGISGAWTYSTRAPSALTQDSMAGRARAGRLAATMSITARTGLMDTGILLLGAGRGCLRRHGLAVHGLGIKAGHRQGVGHQVTPGHGAHLLGSHRPHRLHEGLIAAPVQPDGLQHAETQGLVEHGVTLEDILRHHLGLDPLQFLLTDGLPAQALHHPFEG